MNVTQLIAKKRDGGELTDGEIGALIAGYVGGTVADYQMSALAMAIYLRGMSSDETASLTRHMLNSGKRLAWDDGDSAGSAETAIRRIGKHSTGGVGDKVSIVLAPLLACCGVQVPKISGRGLGATGGTLDKLESIPGFRTDLSVDELQQIVREVGCAISGATDDLVPADRKLYALRDVTATVGCLPLIASSIMSKKLAEGLHALVLDVKWGSGAFMKSLNDARKLARSMVDIGTHLNVRTTALITDMNQPLGCKIGNAHEVEECLETLHGGGPADLRALTIELAAEVLVSAGVAKTLNEGRVMASAPLESGAVLAKFEQMVAAHGGHLEHRSPHANCRDVLSDRAGIVQSIDAESLGHVLIALGGGRRVKTDRIDHSVGLEMRVRIGDVVEAGQPLVRVFAKTAAYDTVCSMIRSAITIGEESVLPPPLIVERID